MAKKKHQNSQCQEPKHEEANDSSSDSLVKPAPGESTVGNSTGKKRKARKPRDTQQPMRRRRSGKVADVSGLLASSLGKNKASSSGQKKDETVIDETGHVAKQSREPGSPDRSQAPVDLNPTVFPSPQSAEDLTQGPLDPDRRFGRSRRRYWVNGKRVSNPEKGLPKAEDILKLARVWLREQRRLWPELVEANLIPAHNEAVDEMANQFKQRFLERTPKPFEHLLAQVPWASKGTTYVRYSSATQNPRSLDDQLRKILEWAAAERIFVPWEYVCSDSGISGRVASRTGYQMALAALRLEGEVAPDTFMVEEIDRMSRDSIEILEIGKLISEHNKRLVGVTNGFDSNDPQARLMLHFYAMFNEQYMTQHRDKVLRGRRGAVSRGTVTRPLPWGLTKTPSLDSYGREIKNSDGSPKTVAIPHPEYCHIIEQIGEMYVDRKMSLRKITMELNLTRAGGRDGWQASSIAAMLDNSSYVGIFVEGKTRHVKCRRTGKTKQVAEPRSKWTVKRVRSAQIWSWQRWKQIQARRAKYRNVGWGRDKLGSKTHRTDAYPTTLFGGILVCKSCDHPLRLAKVEESNHFLRCPNGKDRRYGCTLTSGKSNHLVEPYLLDYIRETLLTPEVILQLVNDANQYILELQSEAPEDISPLRANLDELRRSRDRLISLVAGSLAPSLDAVRSKLSAIEAEMATISRRIQEAEAQTDSQIAPLTKAGVLSLLDNIDEVLKQDVPNANEALRLLLGAVPIYQFTRPGRKLATWVAEIQGDLMPLMAHAGRFHGTPDASSLTKLIGRKWSFKFLTKITLDTPSQTREQLTAPVEALLIKGLTIHDVALRCGTTPTAVDEIKRMMLWKAKPKARQKRTAEYVKRAEEVGRLVRGGLSVCVAAKKLGIGNNVAYNAWSYFQRVESGVERIDTNARFTYEAFAEEVARLYQDGVSKNKIAKRLDISRPTVSKAIRHHQLTSGDKTD